MTRKPLRRAPAPKPKRGLTVQQQRFVAEYLVDFNGKGAAIRAGYSERTAAEQGYDLLRRPHIAAAIAARHKKQLEKADLTAARLREELRRNCFFDIRNIYEQNGNLKPITELADDEAACIAGVEVVKRNLTGGDDEIDEIHKVKINPKLQAIELAAKLLGLLEHDDPNEDRPTVPVFLLPPGSRVETE